MTDEEIQALRDKHKNIRVVRDTAAGEDLVFRAPSRQEFRKMKMAAVSDDRAELIGATENLMLDTIVSHTREQLASIIDRAPGLEFDKRIKQALAELNGSTASTEGKD